MDQTLYRRPLPDPLVPFASERGRELFGEALAEGRMHGYFRLAQQFHTQAEPAFCSLGSLVVALNALDIDPGRLWQGPWRWFSEEMLDCCVPLEHRARGWLSLTPSETRLSLGFWLESTAPSWAALAANLRRALAEELSVEPAPDLRDAMSIYLRGVIVAGLRIRSLHSDSPEHERALQRIHMLLHSSRLWQLASELAPPDMNATLAAMLLATAPGRWLSRLPEATTAEWEALVTELPAAVHAETQRIHSQIEEILCTW